MWRRYFIPPCKASQSALLSSEGFFLTLACLFSVFAFSPSSSEQTMAFSWSHSRCSENHCYQWVKNGPNFCLFTTTTRIMSLFFPPVPLFHQCLLKPDFPAAEKHLSYLHIKGCEDPVNELLGSYLESWFFEIIHIICPCCPLMQLGMKWGQTGGSCWNNSIFWCIAGYDPEISTGGKFYFTTVDLKQL